MTSDILLRELRNGVLRLTLNEPATRNALSQTMMTELQQALDSAAINKTIRVIIIAAMGPVYCSGHNLREITAHRSDPDRGRAFFAELMSQCARLMATIVRHPRPVIGEISGMATAAGCQLIASCDIVIAADTAHFCTPGVNIGLFCSTPMVALSRAIAPKHAMEMLLTGDPVGAAEAYRFGLVNRVVSPNELSVTTEALAQQIGSKSTLTIKTGKQAFQRQLEMRLEDAYSFTAAVMIENLLAHDAEEGIGAFLDRRTPHWKDS